MVLKIGNGTQKGICLKKKKKINTRKNEKKSNMHFKKNLKNKVFFGSRASVAMPATEITQQTPLKS